MGLSRLLSLDQKLWNQFLLERKLKIPEFCKQTNQNELEQE